MALSESVRAQLLASFRVESQEHIQAITDGLLALEQPAITPPERRTTLDKIFRAAHSLKGAARTVDAQLVTQGAHALEDVLEGLRHDAIKEGPALFTACYRALDLLNEVRDRYGDVEPPPGFAAALAALAAFRGDAEGGEPSGPPEAPAPVPARTSTPPAVTPVDVAPPPPARPAPADEETIRVQVGKLDALMGQLGELLVTKIRIEQRLDQLHEINAQFAAWDAEWTSARSAYGYLLRHRAALEALPQHGRAIAAILDYLESSQERLRDLSGAAGALSRDHANDVLHMAFVVDELEDEIKRVRMLPLSTILTPFGRMARDLAYETGKEVILQVTGAETELDKRVLEQIKDPLTHLLRNAIDHGIEPPEARAAREKPRYGTVTLSAEQVGKAVIVRVADDGRGLDLEAIRMSAARLRGPEALEMTDEALVETIYEAGLSTSPAITDVSGRGVGLDVVRRNVQALGGRIDVTWQPGAGTTFALTLPLTLSRTRGLLVRAGGQRFALPLAAIEHLVPLAPGRVTTLSGRDVLRYHDHHIPLVVLGDLLELPPARLQNGNVPAAVIMRVNGHCLALAVEGLEGELEIVSKGLGRQLVHVGGVAGAAVMGSGDVVLVLDVAGLVKLAMRGEQRAAFTLPEPSGNGAAPERRRLLIVDDSITTRTLERNILEAAGYQVQVATNGQEAWEALASGDLPDLVISDVAMPKMTGIELTERIKGNPRTAELPVILVTSLDSPRDRARGIEAGADAYISKGAFDQSGLLSTIKQLI